MSNKTNHPKKTNPLKYKVQISVSKETYQQLEKTFADYITLNPSPHISFPDFVRSLLNCGLREMQCNL